jgi:excisionase family DNA binding protein
MPYREPTPEPLAVRIPIAMHLIGIRRSKLYELIKSGELRTVKVGRATLITMSSLRRLVEQ